MKKLMRKLVLSCFALGLAVVTLTTTTFAWYTSNTEASTNAVQGNTSSASSSDTLLVSATGRDNTWSNTCTPAVNNAVMLPVQYTGSNYTYVLTKTQAGESAQTAGSNDYLKFDVYFKTTKNEGTKDAEIPVYIKSVTISNTGTLTDFDNLLAGQGIPGAPTGAVYTVDMTRALNMVTTSLEGGNDSNVKNHLDLTGVSTPLDSEKGLSDTVDAIKYYNAVMEDDLADQAENTKATKVTTTDGNYNAINLGSLICSKASSEGVAAEYSILKVSFVIYLDGWDQYCFDACKGQTFSVELSFTTTLDDVTIGTVKTN